MYRLFPLIPDPTSIREGLLAIVESCRPPLIHDLKAKNQTAVAGTVACITIVLGN